MDIKNYQTLATKSFTDKKEHSLMGAIYLAEETGEVVRPLKRHYFRGYTLDKENLIEEMGDLIWSLTQIASAEGIDLEEVLERNLQKLKTAREGH